MDSAKKYTQDFVRIKDVRDGTILTEDGRYVRILEIKPINLQMKSQDEQAAILRGYASLIKSAPPRFSIKCITKETSVDEYKKSFEESFRNETDDGCKEYIASHVNYTLRLSSSQSTDHAMFFIYEYDADSDYYRSMSEDEKIESLKMTERGLISAFSALGNVAIEFKDPDVDVMELVYNHNNRRIFPSESFQSRVRRTAKDTAYAAGVLKSPLPSFSDLRDITASRSINTGDSPDYMLVDGMYCSYFYVDKDSYPTIMDTNGWLSQLINFAYGVEVDMFFERKDSVEALSKIQKSSRLTRIKRNSRESTSPDIEEINDNLDALDFMREALKRNSEEIYKMSILVSVYAYSKEELYAKKESLTRFAKIANLGLLELKYVQDFGYISSMPLNRIYEPLAPLSKHDVYTSVIAAAYPFTSFSLMDSGGFLMGLHGYNNSLVVFNPFDSKKYSNANMTIFGAPGKGKTFTLLSMTTRLRYMGTQVFILAPDKQDEFMRVTDAIGGEFVSVSPAAATRINPFDIWPVESEADNIINNKLGNETSWLIEKIDSLSHWVEMMVKGISIEDKARVKICLTRMYQRKGITQDNHSIYSDFERKTKKDMPIFTDFVRELKNDQTISSEIITVFEQFTKKDGAYKNLNGPTNVDLENKYIVFGLEYIKGDLQAPMMYILLKFIWSVAKADKTRNKAIVIDEGSLLVNGKDKNMGEFVVEIFRMIRGYGGSAIFATQSVSDLFLGNGEFGNAILSCSHSHILLGMQPNEIRLVTSQFELTKGEEEAIRDFSKPGEALLCAGSIHVPVIIKASDKEFDLFTTSSDELKRIAKQKM